MHFNFLEQISKPKISEVTVVKDKTLINWSLENENNEQKINKIYVDICQNFSDPSASIETKSEFFISHSSTIVILISLKNLSY